MSLLRDFNFFLQFRQETTGFCRDHNIALQFFNGGGTGSLQDACADPSLTEVSAGSGFLQGHLFDNYSSNQCLPAAVYALQITRLVPNILVCQGGGFIASGTLSEDKLPVSSPSIRYASELCLSAIWGNTALVQ